MGEQATQANPNTARRRLDAGGMPSVKPQNDCAAPRIVGAKAHWLSAQLSSGEKWDYLASLLRRLRRATAIETGLLQSHADNEFGNDEPSRWSSPGHTAESQIAGFQSFSANEITQCLRHLTAAESVAFENVRRYETALWRQLRQTLFTLQILACQKREVYVSRLHKGWWKSTDSFDR